MAFPGVDVVASAEDSAGTVAVDWPQEEKDVDLGEEEGHPLILDEIADLPEVYQAKEWPGASQLQHLELYPHFESTQGQMVLGLLDPQVQENYHQLDQLQEFAQHILAYPC